MVDLLRAVRRPSHKQCFERNSFYLSTNFQDILLRNVAFQTQTPNIKIVNRLTDNMVTNIELLKCTIQCPSVVNCLDFTGNGEFNFISKANLD